MKDGLRGMDGCGFGIGQLPTLARQSRRTLFFEQGACRIFRKPPLLLHASLTLARVALLSGALPCTKGRLYEIGRRLQQGRIFGQAAVTATADTYAKGASGQKNMICCDDGGYA